MELRIKKLETILKESRLPSLYTDLHQAMDDQKTQNIIKLSKIITRYHMM